MYPQLKPLKQKKLHQQIKKQEVKEKRIRLYLINENWLKIRKQKDRRRRRVMERLWRIKQLSLMKTGNLPLPSLS
jgi:hypothetical protein